MSLSFKVERTFDLSCFPEDDKNVFARHETVQLGDENFTKFSRSPTGIKVVRTYLYACWLCFIFAFFRIKDSTDLYDFWYP